MEVVSRPSHSFSVPSPSPLQFSSQTFKKRSHGEHVIAKDEEINGSWTLRIEIVLETESRNEQYLNGAAVAEYGEDVIVENVRVLGYVHIGRLQSDLVKSVNTKLPHLDLSDHKFWWPANKQWLTKSRYTLDQYGLNAECLIEFRAARRPLIVQLPDLQQRKMMIDFSVSVFRVVIQICKELKLRHPEELSLMLPMSRDDQRAYASKQLSIVRKPVKKSEFADGGTLLTPTTGSEPRWTVSPTQTMNPKTMKNTPTGRGYPTGTFQTPMSPFSATLPGRAPMIDANGVLTPSTGTMMRTPAMSGQFYDWYSSLVNSPTIAVTEAAQRLSTSRPRGIVDKAFANACWLDSSKTLLEQSIDKNDRVMLRFKFYAFFDLKPTKPNAVRLNQLFEQAKWSILGEEVEATDEEAFNFAGLQYQIRTRQALDTSSTEDLLSNQPSSPRGLISPNSSNQGSTSRPINADDVDAAITQLQFQLETGLSPRTPAGSAFPSSTLHRPTPSPRPLSSNSPASAGQENLQEVPELKDFIKISRKSKFFLKFSSSSPNWLVLRDLHLSIHKTKDDFNNVEHMKLVGCEVLSTVRSASDKKFPIRLFVPHSDGMTELVLKCKDVQQYASWLAAFRLASRGKSMADSSYENEVSCVLSSLTSPSRGGMSGPNKLVITSPLSKANGSRGLPNPPVELHIAEYLPNNVAKRYKPKEVINRILEAHSRVSAMSSTEAKLAYIRQWESLPYFDISYVLVKLVQVGSVPVTQTKNNGDQIDVLGVTPHKLIRYDSPKTMSIMQVWPFERITSWQVDWEKRVVRVESADGDLAFTCSSCDCKVFHELLGGYIFMALRSSTQNKQLDEEMFQKLTGGRE